MTIDSSAFVRCNIDDLNLVAVRAHGGDGLIWFRRIVSAGGLAARCNFIDYAIVPPGMSIGRHRHAPDEEELYLVLSGRGTMFRDGEDFAIREGDLIRNRAGGLHGLVNTGTEDLRIFVIELPVP